jgi:IS30 family transposase
MIGRNESTIGREIRRNSDASGLYLYPAEAHQASLAGLF